MSNNNQSLVNTQFRVIVEGYDEVSFQSCTGLEAEIEVIYHAEGGRGMNSRAVRGAPRAQKIYFSNGTASKGAGKKNLMDWLKDVMDFSKPLHRENLTIQLLDADQKALRTWKIKDAWPCRWTGPLLSREGSGLTVEQVVFAHEGIAW